MLVCNGIDLLTGDFFAVASSFWNCLHRARRMVPLARMALGTRTMIGTRTGQRDGGENDNKVAS